ncbi:hypothetical protein GKZ28_09815 [Clostridium chromiireducens]|uniref:DUF2238 domain-containing protein n=1 Tax=Clostridium chromiireducens TaxID=225345 RepID=A0A964RLP2_9CLOT|nr:hypothetical protein [Clostridium chromiireducens]MVX63988.1 hypothetical protein [Clostridium chromiireducens]
MKNKDNTLAIGIAILFEIIAISTVIIKIISKQWNDMHLLFLVIICLTLPFVITYIANKYNFVLPSSFQLVSVSFILLAQYFGEFIQLYTTFSWWDLFLHGCFGCYAPIIGLHLMTGIITWDSGVTKKRFVIFTGIIAFCFTLAVGVLWEIFEFLGDYFLKTGMTTGGLEDTMTDLIIKTLFALATTLIYCYKKLKNSKY